MKFTSAELRLLRTLCQMKQEVVGLKMGISKQRVSQIENHPDHVEGKTIEKYLEALGFTSKSARKYLSSLSQFPVSIF